MSTRAPGETESDHDQLLAFVEEAKALFKPEQVVWCDGSQAEWDRLTGALVDTGALGQFEALELVEEGRAVSGGLDRRTDLAGEGDHADDDLVEAAHLPRREHHGPQAAAGAGELGHDDRRPTQGQPQPEAGDDAGQRHAPALRRAMILPCRPAPK